MTTIKNKIIQHEMACSFKNFVLYNFHNKLVENVVGGCYRLGNVRRKTNKFLQGQIIDHCEVARETVKSLPTKQSYSSIWHNTNELLVIVLAFCRCSGIGEWHEMESGGKEVERRETILLLLLPTPLPPPPCWFFPLTFFCVFPTIWMPVTGCNSLW